MKRGFTIVELIVVIAIIGILMGIVTTAAAKSVSSARTHRMNALCKLVGTGLATYNVREGDWPVAAQTLVDQAPDGETTVELKSDQVRQSVQKMVEMTREGVPVMDVSGLWVALRDSDPAGRSVDSHLASCKVYGMDFVTAIRGSKSSPKKHSTSELYYGYADPPTGLFLRFRMVYSIPTDSLSVRDWR